MAIFTFLGESLLPPERKKKIFKKCTYRSTLLKEGPSARKTGFLFFVALCIKFMHKIVAKYWQNYIYSWPLFANFPQLCQYIGKNNKTQRIFQQQSLENGLSDLAQIWELSLVCFSLCGRHILISNTTTSFCLYNHLLISCSMTNLTPRGQNKPISSRAIWAPGIKKKIEGPQIFFQCWLWFL